MWSGCTEYSEAKLYVLGGEIIAAIEVIYGDFDDLGEQIQLVECAFGMGDEKQ